MDRPLKPKSVPFSPALIPGVQSGAKSQTRRTRGLKEISPSVFPRVEMAYSAGRSVALFLGGNGQRLEVECSYGGPGGQLWVKEQLVNRFGWVTYGADQIDVRRCGGCGLALCTTRGASGLCNGTQWDRGENWPWKPKVLGAMYCPRWASRITLDVLSVRVERLQEISEEDAEAEGVERVGLPDDRRPVWKVGHELHESARAAFSVLWESINGPDSWDANPWVWVIGFKRAGVPRA